MRAAPPLRVKVERFDVWNALLAGLGLLVVLVAGVWFASDHGGLPPWCGWLFAFFTAASVLGVGCGLRWLPVFLRWDSRHWYCARQGNADQEDGPRRVRVPIDLGVFMLLRLESHDDSNPMSPRWLPVQRRGLPADWHALRCAVHSRGLDRAPSTTPHPAESN